MHFVVTTTTVQPGSLDDIKAGFEEAVPKIAGGFSAWRGAKLTADRESNQIVMIGSWADPEQMGTFLAQPEYREAIGRFAQFFTAPPNIVVTELVTEVLPE